MAIPTVFTSAASFVTATEARLNGSITDDGGSSITERGFYFGATSGNLTAKIVEGGTATGSFSSDLNNLNPNTYYFEAFATNADGEARGDEFSFTTSNALVLTSDVANLFSHNVYFQIAVTDTTTATYDIDLIDMGKLKYSFDIPNSGEDVTAVGIKSGAIDVKFDNYIDGTDTIIDLLDSSFSFDSNQTWFGKMFFKLKSESSYGNPILFEFTPKEVEFDEISQICNISFIPRQESPFNGVELGEEADSQIFSYDVNGQSTFDFTAMTAKDYIRHFLYQTYADYPVYPISGVSIKINSGIFDIDGSSLITSGEHWMIFYEALISGSPATISDPSDAEVVVGTLASLEGAIYGSALGDLFYVSRSSTSFSETLDTDNIEKIKQGFFVEAEYRQLNLTQIDQDENDINVIAFSKNPLAEKNINIRLNPTLLLLVDVTSSGVGDAINEDNTILLEATANYQPAFSFDNEKKVSLTYWGIDGIYPYSVINFDTNAPEFVKNRDFRIKNIEYDFKADKFEAEMYEI